MATFDRTTLSNGTRVLTAPMPHAQSVACFVMFAAGSRYERREESGIAHFAEHMFFKGTERRPTARDIATEIDGIGGEFNAFTGKELTGYYVKCAAETRDVALDVLVDMLRNSRFDADEIDREKGVIVEEMNMYADTPRDYVGNVWERHLYGDQPLGWDIIGTEETVRGATRDTFLGYLDRWYRPERMVVGLGGKLGDDLLERLEELLGDVAPEATGAADAVVLPTNGEPGADPHEAVRPGARRRRRAELPARPPRPLRAAASLDRARRRHVVAPLHRGARAARARVLRLLREQLVRRRGHARRAGRRRPHPHRRGDRDDRRRAARGSSPSRCRPRSSRRRALREGPLRPRAREPARARSCSGSAASCSRAGAVEPEEVLAGLDAVTVEDVQRVAQTFSAASSDLALVGPFDDPERFEPLLAA